MDKELKERGGIDWELDVWRIIKNQDWVTFNIIYKYIKKTRRII